MCTEIEIKNKPANVMDNDDIVSDLNVRRVIERR